MILHCLMDRIREEGRVDNKNNTDFSECHNRLSNVFDLMTKANHLEKDLYPTDRIDKNFDSIHRNDILKKDNNFQEKMNDIVQKSINQNIIDRSVWKVSDNINSLQNVGSVVNHFQNLYDESKHFYNLDSNFIVTAKPSFFIVNGYVIPSNSKMRMIKDFKDLVPDIEFQKLIATYSNPSILSDASNHLNNEYPELKNYNIKNSQNIYKINHLDHGLVKIVITNLVDLEAKNTAFVEKKYTSRGIRATVIVSPREIPVIKYSHFIQ